MKKTRPTQWFRWQIDGFEKFSKAVDKKKQDFLAAVTGGGGKTLWALENARRMFAVDEIDRVIVVTFTSHLVRQWDESASALGINLLAVAGNSKLKSGLPPDVVGYICTYAALGRMPDLHETFANECRTLVIFDEIHHLGDVDEKTRQSKWGDGAKIAFRSAAWRLSLSGTPFRSNASRIPFVEYVPVDGSNIISEAIFDHTYSYGMAVRDGVCRRVVFHDSDGPIEWRRGDMGGTTLRHRFDDALDPRYHNDRLRFAVCAETDGGQTKNLLLQEMLIRANNRLNDIRKAGDSDAGGLIVADRIPQARDIKEMLQRLTGVRAVIVHNEEDRALAQIDAFRNGVAPWIISVKMITEGVDIPRLRVCVYAAVVAENAELFLSQIIFRIVRKPPNAVGESYFFYPADQRLKDVTAKIEAEMQARIDEREREKREGGEPPERIAKAFVGAEYETSSATIAGQTYDEVDIQLAEEFRKQGGDAMRDIPILDLVKFYHQYGKYDKAKREPFETSEESYNEKRERLRRELKNLVGRLFYKMNKPHNFIHNGLNEQVGIPDTESASNEQLEKKANIAREWLSGYDTNGQQDQDEDDDIDTDDL
jgi:superfamily II DNA or RNA helicase